MRFRWSLVVAAVLFMPPATADASSILFSNGALADVDSGGRCDSQPGVCGGTGSWTFYDNFVLAANSTVTGFDYTDFFFSGGPAGYVLTNWSIWNTDPLLPGAPVASGVAVATLSPLALPGSPYLFTVGGLNLNLSGGTEYWLGINNRMLGSEFLTTVGEAVGVLPGAKQSDGSQELLNNQPERAFTVYGPDAVVPEPATLLLLSAGLLGVAATRRRRKARQ